MTNRTDRTNPAAAPESGPLDTLERILHMQLEGHQRLGELLQQKHDAIRRADLEAIETLCGEEERMIARLRALDHDRGAAAAEVAGRAPDATPGTISELTAGLEEPRRGRLRDLAERLRDTVRQVRRDSAVARSAAETLSRHLAGIMESATSALSRAGVYGRGGRMAAGGQVYSTVDVTS